MDEQNPERVANRGLLGTDEDPSGHSVKQRVQTDPCASDVEATPQDDLLDTQLQARAKGLKAGDVDEEDLEHQPVQQVDCDS
jgi:hypothetical protein